MSSAFESLTIPAGIVLVLIILKKTVGKASASMSAFIQENYIILMILMLVIALVITAYVIVKRCKSNKFSITDHILYTVSTFCVVSFNLAFFLTGLQSVFDPKSELGLITLIGLAGFVVIYAVSLFVTVGCILFSIEKKYGFWIPLSTFCATLLLILAW